MLSFEPQIGNMKMDLTTCRFTVIYPKFIMSLEKTIANPTKKKKKMSLEKTIANPTNNKKKKTNS